jgi:CubicO group peptidase (beta-lactamase class C family)
MLDGVSRIDDHPAPTFRASMNRSAFRLNLTLLLLYGTVCIGNAQAYEYAVPDQTQDGWEITSLAKAKIDAEMLRPMFERIASGQYKNIRSVLIARDGKLVVEEYFPRTEGDRRGQALRRVSPIEMTSATKSVTSLLIGIAIDQQRIKGVDEKVSTFLPEYADVFADAKKTRLTIKDLLTMSAGLSWDEWSYPYTDPRNDHGSQILRSNDPIRFVLERPIVAEPGEKFTYNSGLSIVLGQILLKASGMRADKFAERNLFEPLGITDFYWSKLPDEIVQTGGGLFMRPRDMAKLGQLMLDGGRWRGKPIVSEAWVNESTRVQVDASKIPAAAMAGGYGFHWWVDSLKAGDRVVKSFSARGRGGQYIVVMPQQRMVVIMTCAVDNPLLLQPLELLQQYILPAAVAPPPTTTP